MPTRAVIAKGIEALSQLGQRLDSRSHFGWGKKSGAAQYATPLFLTQPKWLSVYR